MTEPGSNSVAPAGVTLARGERLTGIIGLGGTIALLYFGRSILIPLTVAVLLSFLAAPFVRLLRHAGFGKSLSVLVTVVMATALFLALAVTMVGEMAHLAAGLAQYQDNLQGKVTGLQEMTAGRLVPLLANGEKFWSQMNDEVSPPARRGGESRGLAPPAEPRGAGASGSDGEPLVVEVHEPPATLVQLARRLLGSVAGPLETGAVIFVVWVFVLLDQEGLRDRLIRVAGSTDLRRTTAAMDDAGKRLSRYFVSQLVVNAGMGSLIALGLWAIGIPSAILFGTLATVLRFIPYFGVWIAALLALAIGAAVDPGWSHAILVLALFGGLEALVGQVIEPLLYGHTTGLSPVSVILAAIFWAGIWGPVGLILSTPLTLCLVVLARYVEPLKFLEILLGDAPALALHQQFYQRVLAGDSHEIIEKARTFLKDKTFVEYCDAVVLPAVQLASADELVGLITPGQRRIAAATATHAIETLSGDPPSERFWRRKTAVLEALNPHPGDILRARRLARQKISSADPRGAVAGSVLLCIGLDTQFDDIAVEIIVRALRQLRLDGRPWSLRDLAHASADDPGLRDVSAVLLVSIDARTERDEGQAAVTAIHRVLPETMLISLFHPVFFAELQMPEQPLEGISFHARGVREALGFCLSAGAPVASDAIG